MLPRLLALALAAFTAATGVLPALDGTRCVAMDRAMSADDECPHCRATSSTIGTPCREAVHVSSLEARANPAPHQPRLAPAPLAALAALLWPPPFAVEIPRRDLATHPRGQPPPRAAVLRI